MSGVTEPRLRPAARVIVLDHDDRLLLLRYDEAGHIFWAVPGGSLEDGETYEQAARRELYEELGLTSSWSGPGGRRYGGVRTHVGGHRCPPRIAMARRSSLVRR